MKLFHKFTLAAAVFTAAGFAASAQPGIHIGATVPVYEQRSIPNPSNRLYKAGLGGYAGADYDFHIVKGFHITPGLYYNLTMVPDFTNHRTFMFKSKEIQTDHALQIPLHFKYVFNIRPDRFAIYLYAGPMLTVGLASDTAVSIESATESISCDFNNYTGEISNIDTNISDLDNIDPDTIETALTAYMGSVGLTQRHIDIQLDCGLGFRFNRHWELSTGYTFGFLNRYNGAISNDITMKQSQFYLGFNYRF